MCLFPSPLVAICRSLCTISHSISVESTFVKSHRAYITFFPRKTTQQKALPTQLSRLSFNQSARMRSSSSFLVAVSLVLCLFVPNDQFVHAKGVHLFNVGTTTWDQPPSQQLVQTRSKPIDDFQKRLSTLVRTSRINNVIKIRGGVVISKGKKVRRIDSHNTFYSPTATRIIIIITYPFPHHQFSLLFYFDISPRRRTR